MALFGTTWQWHHCVLCLQHPCNEGSGASTSEIALCLGLLSLDLCLSKPQYVSFIICHTYKITWTTREETGLGKRFHHDGTMGSKALYKLQRCQVVEDIHWRTEHDFHLIVHWQYTTRILQEPSIATAVRTNAYFSGGKLSTAVPQPRRTYAHFLHICAMMVKPASCNLVLLLQLYLVWQGAVHIQRARYIHGVREYVEYSPPHIESLLQDSSMQLKLATLDEK